ncbi:DUF1566 domain-containing protein [Sulfurovum sp.]|uniref:Lcl C-terminal domain-containing protein n=1 Tax=Sulfurovum sp. TaxID=1969726 RepID=UPI002600DED4|nr:DUF1566 domain-containing protein [Sulfurovum sp.]
MRPLFVWLLTASILFGASSKLDDRTGLVWQDNQAVAEVTKSYSDAKKYCEQLKVDGFEDWRLPTLSELYTIVDMRRERPALKYGFEMRVEEWFWTATLFAGDPKREAWRLSFRYGEAEPSRQERTLHVRCVRGSR